MKKYLVIVSVLGGAAIEIVAKNKEEAENKIYDLSNMKILEELDFSIEIDDIQVI